MINWAHLEHMLGFFFVVDVWKSLLNCLNIFVNPHVDVEICHVLFSFFDSGGLSKNLGNYQVVENRGAKLINLIYLLNMWLAIVTCLNLWRSRLRVLIEYCVPKQHVHYQTLCSRRPNAASLERLKFWTNFRFQLPD